jgi:hypothetical protein
MAPFMQTITDSSSLDENIVADFLLNGTWDTSSELLDYEDRKARLLSLIDEMESGGPSWDGEPANVSEAAASTARRFLKSLPTDRELPKICPDGEGDLLFVWEPPIGNCIVTVQDNMLHMVEQPGTQSVEHIDNQEFLGRRIPVSILPAIPKR